MSFKFEKLKIPGLVVITPDQFGDQRGFFMETYKKSVFHDHGIDFEFVQDNLSQSKGGTIRGLHYQLNPMAQGKLLRVITGEIYEVAVDIRLNSPFFGKWDGVLMSSENRKMFWIPPGFAAGMVTLKDDSLLAYKTTSEYSKEHERGILWSDPRIGITWPISVSNPLLSPKDAVHPLIDNAEINFEYER